VSFAYGFFYVTTPDFGFWTNLEVILRWHEKGHG
jgi:hypothetical protein